MQHMMGKLDRNSVTKRVARFRIKRLPAERAKKSRKLLKDLDFDQVKAVSKEAATIFAWVGYSP